jgi:hypothetical protein
MKTRLLVADTVPGRDGGANALIFRQIDRAVCTAGISILKSWFQI